MKKYPKYIIDQLSFKIIIGSILCIILSYVLMHFGSKNNIEVLSLTISPIMQLIGYSTIIIAIIKS